MREIFDPHNVETCRASFNGDEIEAVDEMDYRTLLLLYDDAISMLTIYQSVIKEMLSDDAFIELCQSIGEEPRWLDMARTAVKEDSK